MRLSAYRFYYQCSLTSSKSMDKKPPQTPEMKGFLDYLDGKISPRKKLQIRASIMTTYIIADLQRRNRIKK